MNNGKEQPMKKMIMLMLLVGFTIKAMAGTITWLSNDLGTTGYTDGWLVALYEDVNKNGWTSSSINPLTGETDSDDVLLTITTTLVFNTKDSYFFWGDNFSAPGGGLSLGDYVYSVLFNAPTISEATQYKVTTMTGDGQSWYQMPLTDIDNTYTTTTMSAWQVIPEPATALLFFLGVAGAWIVRRTSLS